MRNYDGSPNLLLNTQVAKTTWLELEQSAHAVVEALERENPNYVILNEGISGVTQYYSNQQLYDANVLKVGYDLNTDQAFVLFLGSALRLHRGLLSKQDPTYVFFGDENEWLLAGGRTETWVEGNYPEVDDLLDSLSITKATDVWVIDLTNLAASKNWLTGTKDSGVLEINFDLQPTNTEYFPTLNVGTGSSIMKLTIGYVIICNTLEENEPMSRYSTTRLKKASYLVHPRGIAAGYWVPDALGAGETEWTWQYKSKANENGTSTWFIFNAPNTRFIYKRDLFGKSVNETDYKCTVNTTLYSWSPTSVIDPKWTFQGKNTVPWFNQLLLYRTYVRDDNNNEEEIFVDDEFERGTTVLDGHTDPSYTVNIKDMPNTSAFGMYLRFF